MLLRDFILWWSSKKLLALVFKVSLVTATIICFFLSCYISQFLLNYTPMSVSDQFIFIHNQKVESITCIAFMPHFSTHSSRPLKVAFANLGYTYKHTTTTSTIHSACPSTFFAIQFCSVHNFFFLFRDFYFMKCFDSTIFKLSWSKCIKCYVALFSMLSTTSSSALLPSLQRRT
jgi:hypothetical protein